MGFTTGWGARSGRGSWRRRLPLAVVLVLVVGVVTALAAPNTTTFAFVARGDNPIDALAAAPVAGRLNAPVLLTPPGTLADAARDGLVDAAPDVVIIAGGTGAVSQDVQDAITALLPDADVRRVAGDSRYVTAAELAALIRTIEPAFAMTEGADTNAYGIACPSGQMLTGITETGQADCATDHTGDPDTNAYDIGCPDGQTLNGITDTGQPDCATDATNDLDAYCQLVAANPASYPSGPCLTIPTTLNKSGDVGTHTSIAIGTDGMPIIAYYEGGGVKDLKVAHCTTTSCSTTDSPIYLDQTGEVGRYTSIAIGTDGMPIIAYYDASNWGLEVVHCTDTSCSSTDAPSTVDDGNGSAVGQFTSIAVGTDGMPIIAYYAATTGDASSDDLKVVHCTDLSCSTADAPTTVDHAGDVGQYTSIAIGTDGMPIISYFHAGNHDLKVVHCTTISCSTADTPQTLDTTGEVGLLTSIAIGTDGMPIIAYHDNTNGDLKVVHCTTISCSTADTPQTLDQTGDVGEHASIAIDTDGMPIISYHDTTNGDLKVVHCTTISCDSTDTPQTLDQTGNVGQYISIAIGTDGMPIISYYDATNGDLKVVQVR